MSRIEWNETFSVGNEEIDEQHKKWIGIFNTLRDDLLSGAPKELNNIGNKSLQAMLDYAKVHFKFEEQYMKQINYPDLGVHRRLHKDFDTRVYQFFRDNQEGRIVLGTELISMIKNWLMQHILIEDMKYKIFKEGLCRDHTGNNS